MKLYTCFRSQASGRMPIALDLDLDLDLEGIAAALARRNEALQNRRSRRGARHARRCR
ncbi:MAG TPA: hypothetical protein VMU87_15490 [Stellaceae bacterium]|nr:hypothetical protein [Stellaceae bacterium]